MKQKNRRKLSFINTKILELNIRQNRKHILHEYKKTVRGTSYHSCNVLIKPSFQSTAIHLSRYERSHNIL